MSKLDYIMQKINSSQKFVFVKEKTGMAYTDEPIIFPASKMKNYTPGEYKSMRKLERGGDSFFSSSSELFYIQGKYMETFEDDYPFNEDFVVYYPTYRALTLQQLRGYFTWRTAVRRGEIKEGCLTFAYIYIYELINLIGADSFQDAFDKLSSFVAAYSSFNSKINYYANRWLRDFIVYYGLDASNLKSCNFSPLLCAVQALLDGTDRHSVFGALNFLSAYKIEKSTFYKAYPDDFENAVYKTFLFLCNTFSKGDRAAFTELIIGKKEQLPYYIFNGAVFYERDIHKDCVYKINDAFTFNCRRGIWSYTVYQQTESKKQYLGQILKFLDSELRNRYSFRHKLKSTELQADIKDSLIKIADAVLKEKKQREIPKIEIDLSQLQQIRDIAQKTQEKLLVQQDENFDEISDVAEPAAHKSEAEPLGKAFIRCLLEGRDYGELIKKSGVMLSVLADRVNEEYFEIFEDTIIIFDGEKPVIVEDYAEDLKGLIYL